MCQILEDIVDVLENVLDNLVIGLHGAFQLGDQVCVAVLSISKYIVKKKVR